MSLLGYPCVFCFLQLSLMDSASPSPEEKKSNKGTVIICVGGKIMGWARPIFLEKRGGPKENFTMVGGGSLCVL